MGRILVLRIAPRSAKQEPTSLKWVHISDKHPDCGMGRARMYTTKAGRADGDNLSMRSAAAADRRLEPAWPIHRETAQPASSQTLSLGASIVVYGMGIEKIEPLLVDLEKGGAAQLYVVDNTPHGPSAASRAAAARHPNLELHHPGKNLGYGRGHNIAIGRSVLKYKYHLICNPDITLGENTLAILHDFMEAHPEVGLCMPKLVGPDGEMHFCCRRSPVALDYVSQLLLPTRWGRRRKDSLELRSRDYEQSMEVPCLSGCFMFFRSDVLQRLGGFDDRFFLYFEDLDLSARARKLGKNVYFPNTWVVHERQSGHRNSWTLKARFAVSACRYFAKWGWVRSKADNDGGAVQR
jgi:GT2 family glycosyltransferase